MFDEHKVKFVFARKDGFLLVSLEIQNVLNKICLSESREEKKCKF